LHQNDESSITRSNKGPFRILLVDDERDITSVKKRGLASNGFEVDAINDPVEALSNFKSGIYDLLLFNVKMPKMNGFELYKHIYKIDDKMGVYFLSGFESCSEEFKIIFPKLSAICFIRKPISIDELANKIKEQLLQEPTSSL
jgi:DNA-binding response OmpR family regulator